jgi:hypothetical protein
MTVSPLKQSVDAPEHEQFAVLVFEMVAERLSLEADGVLPGQKCPTFMPKRASPADWASQFNQGKLPAAAKKGTYWPPVRAELGLIAACLV